MENIKKEMETMGWREYKPSKSIVGNFDFETQRGSYTSVNIFHKQEEDGFNTGTNYYVQTAKSCGRYMYYFYAETYGSYSTTHFSFPIRLTDIAELNKFLKFIGPLG